MKDSYSFLLGKMKDPHRDRKVVALILFRTLFRAKFNEILKKEVRKIE